MLYSFGLFAFLFQAKVYPEVVAKGVFCARPDILDQDGV